MRARQVVIGIFLTAAPFALATGTAVAEEAPEVTVTTPVDQNLVTVESNARGTALGSPGLLAGNTIQIPVDVPVNVCGNTINVIAALNPTFGNTCVSDDAD